MCRKILKKYCYFRYEDKAENAENFVPAANEEPPPKLMLTPSPEKPIMKTEKGQLSLLLSSNKTFSQTGDMDKSQLSLLMSGHKTANLVPATPEIRVTMADQGPSPGPPPLPELKTIKF